MVMQTLCKKDMKQMYLLQAFEIIVDRGSQLNCIRGVFPLGINLDRRDAIFNHVSTTRSPRRRKVTQS